MEFLILLFLLTVAYILLAGFRKKSATRGDAAKNQSLLLPPMPASSAEIEARRKRQFLLHKHKELFDTLFPYPLTSEQRCSIVDDSHRTMVIASAGSGKTTTLLGKYVFLLKENLATPQEILVLAFNRDIAKEINQKIQKLVQGDVHPEVYTFHKLGKILLQRAKGSKIVEVDPLAKSSKNGLLETVNVKKVIDRAKERYPEIEKWISEFRAMCPYHQIVEFARDEREYKEAIASYPYKRERFLSGVGFRAQRIPSLDAKSWVRSQQELAIINQLIIKGVKV